MAGTTPANGSGLSGQASAFYLCGSCTPRLNSFLLCTTRGGKFEVGADARWRGRGVRSSRRAAAGQPGRWPDLSCRFRFKRGPWNGGIDFRRGDGSAVDARENGPWTTDKRCKWRGDSRFAGGGRSWNGIRHGIGRHGRVARRARCPFIESDDQDPSDLKKPKYD